MASDLRQEAKVQASEIRLKNYFKHDVAHKGVEAVSAEAAGAVAVVEDFRCKKAEIVASVKRDKVEPLRLELHAALNTRYDKF